MTYDINTVLKNVTTLEELQKISKKARQNINFCGYRYLKYDGYKGTTSIYKLQEKV
jgi:protein-L-isoaspartate O-methyltransferase